MFFELVFFDFVIVIVEKKAKNAPFRAVRLPSFFHARVEPSFRGEHERSGADVVFRRRLRDVVGVLLHREVAEGSETTGAFSRHFPRLAHDSGDGVFVVEIQTRLDEPVIRRVAIVFSFPHDTRRGVAIVEVFEESRVDARDGRFEFEPSVARFDEIDVVFFTKRDEGVARVFVDDGEMKVVDVFGHVVVGPRANPGHYKERDATIFFIEDAFVAFEHCSRAIHLERLRCTCFY